MELEIMRMENHVEDHKVNEFADKAEQVKQIKMD